MIEMDEKDRVVVLRVLVRITVRNIGMELRIDDD